MVGARLVASAVVLLAALWDAVKSLFGRACGALTARGTRREPPAIGKGTAPRQLAGDFVEKTSRPRRQFVAFGPAATAKTSSARCPHRLRDTP
ncbi:hypothetical protein XAP412_320072 [Xanthomonas phaseoli pv. phaseoli]|uniref:Secreted protein n=1 Tax=Xanthomonas campestris pv. phaseoli TaxID=317013 RepID=A0AB38E0G8_XANCH|nr:hypothetical protein XAP6984_380069 [Xanthomonas phaseoli pv. phaseoli]SON83832.1 hypothetical protein XAP412_320072 [Xanthomonas phaseoli pv. phaseoli]SON88271.1 hypothetical protein XAP7430_360072 [Xanthomonas phaseoli pv. phaseoli]SOO27436.1 hypothetical protein XAP6164_1610002 [Xanthomonas phaseoli pv. phaseoli]